MNKRVSFKLFFAVVWRGLCQAVEFIGKLLGFGGKSTFAKSVWRVFVGCAAALLLMFTAVMSYMFIVEFVCDECLRVFGQRSRQPYEETHISNNIVVQKFWRGGNRLYNETTGDILMEGLDWVVTSDDKDSLAVFSKGGKRGYLNRFTGEPEIPAEFTRAWVFSEGLAAVEKDKKLVFINHGGDVVIDKDLEVHFNDYDYVFKNGYCVIRDKVTGKYGFIDRNGDWAVQPEYDYVYWREDFVFVVRDGKEGLLSCNMEKLFAPEYQEIILVDSTILARRENDMASLYDLECNLLQELVIDDVTVLEYDTREFKTVMDEDGVEKIVSIYASANCMSYRVGASYSEGHYGLLSLSGRRLTPPIYTGIEAIAEDRYLCHPHGVILDDNGIQVN